MARAKHTLSPDIQGDLFAKQCPHCNSVKYLHDFTIRKDTGRPVSICKECFRAVRRARYAADPGRYKEQVDEYRRNNRDKYNARLRSWAARNREAAAAITKRYRSANKEKVAERKKIYNDKNREAISAKTSEYYQANKESVSKRSRQWVAANRDKVNEYGRTGYARNAEKISVRRKERYLIARERENQKHKEWTKANRPKVTAYTRKRKAAKMQATPLWSNEEKMLEYYFAADFLGMVTGEWYNVDHIVPLRGPIARSGPFSGHRIVCGLHWEGNMQVITATENNKKSNRWWPDMP